LESKITIESPTKGDSLFLPALLFAVTVVTTMIAGSCLHYDFERGLPPFTSTSSWWNWWRSSPWELWRGWTFSLALMASLLSHELGHLFVARWRKIDASYPFFLPGPLPIGTFGAFIRLRKPVHDRNVLFDIAVAGPIAGILVCLPFMVVGLALSHSAKGVDPNPIFTLPLVMELATSFLFNHAGRNDLLLHPMAYGAWVGLFGTALNLLPIGQLDGGKILFCLSQNTFRWLSRTVLAIMVVVGINQNFWSWIVMAILLGFAPNPTPLEQVPAMGNRRWYLLAVCILLFVLCFHPQPIRWE
jgi:membrane-associated protease RseP (regulator of RpoE activity)